MSISGEKKLGRVGVILGAILALVLALGLYVRLAPSDPAVWHAQAYPSGMGEKVSARGYIWREKVVADGAAQLERLDRIIMATPRTMRLAGAVSEGQITYVTRSAVVGFPDYTTIGVYTGLIEDADQHYLEINARLRFGASDLGVNANRVKGWLADLKTGG